MFIHIFQNICTLKKEDLQQERLPYMQHKFQWTHDGITHNYESNSSQPSQVHFPATLQAAEGIPGDNASGMDKTNIFASGSTQGPEDVHRKV